MEALIVVVSVLAMIAVLEAGYCIAVSLARWSPIIAIGICVGWLARRHGTDALDAFGIAILTCLAARCALGPRSLT